MSCHVDYVSNINYYYVSLAGGKVVHPKIPTLAHHPCQEFIPVKATHTKKHVFHISNKSFCSQCSGNDSDTVKHLNVQYVIALPIKTKN